MKETYAERRARLNQTGGPQGELELPEPVAPPPRPFEEARGAAAASLCLRCGERFDAHRDYRCPLPG